ncbi:Uncharacterized protein PECH_004720 [Penicillium ucsense]|uniref:N-acetyltransferase domain-containing protein n=1 Tax=Penicillium ucsense TaxID=2839758 RepID=A0A8J8W3L8_9EURO|nr:Uncharacterized protein PECM_004133 [Penicillium ucsense]KAF7726231.1 Uncharacterized protein PECH_004720 [Penicillium ucsense]
MPTSVPLQAAFPSDSTIRSFSQMQSGPDIFIELFTSQDLLAQPWLSELTKMINASYLVGHTDRIKYLDNKLRLGSDSDLSSELGVSGFTAVAFARDQAGEKAEVIGTASMKPWKNDELWLRGEREIGGEDGNKNEDRIQDEIDGEQADTATAKHVLLESICPGDYELAVVALPPDNRYRGKGIAGRLVKACEDELLRRRSQEGDQSQLIRVMIRVLKENAGVYWLKQGFKVVGSQRRPAGFWDALEPFTLWAMVRELRT